MQQGLGFLFVFRKCESFVALARCTPFHMSFSRSEDSISS